MSEASIQSIVKERTGRFAVNRQQTFLAALGVSLEDRYRSG
jgi:hypothetical protein